MLAYTLKTTVAGFCRSAANDKYIITAKGLETDTTYIFTSYKGKISLDIDAKGILVSKNNIVDLDIIKLADNNFDVTLFEKETFKKDGEPYEFYKVHLDYPVRLFIELFRCLKMRASFTIKHGDRFIDCYYICDKVRWREETDSYCNLHSSDLFKLNNMFPNYEIVTIGSPLHRNSFKQYMTREDNMARIVSKQVRKYENGVLQ